MKQARLSTQRREDQSFLKSADGGKPLVSVVVPAYNESAIIEKGLSTLCGYLKTLEESFNWELFVVNDGSKDNTGALAEAFAQRNERVRVLHHHVNFNLGQALRYAFKESKGDYVVTMDMDLSYAPVHIGNLLNAIVQSRAKIVIASPWT